MSSPSEPVEIVSISMAFSFLPSFMIEPLPKARSIWLSAASRAFDLSMDEPSTRRRAGWLIIALHMAQRLGIRHGAKTCGGYLEGRKTDWSVCTLFVLSSQYVLFRNWVLASASTRNWVLVPFQSQWSPF